MPQLRGLWLKKSIANTLSIADMARPIVVAYRAANEISLGTVNIGRWLLFVKWPRDYLSRSRRLSFAYNGRRTRERFVRM